MNVRKTLTTAHARRCSATAVAGAAAALLLTPSTAFAAGHPAGGERPAGAVVGVSAPASAGVGIGAGVGEPANSGHTAGSTGSTSSKHTGGSSNAHSANHPGHPAHHATANHSGHKTGTRPGHANGHLAGHPTAARAGAHQHKAIADDPSTGTSTSTDPTPHSDHTKPKSGSSTGKPPKSTTPKTPKPGGSKSSESGPMATITKLSMSKNLTSARPLTMSARVSLARRAPGAPKESGTVTFTVDGASSGPIPMNNNRASVKVKITPGKHTAIAKYSGDKSHSPSDSGPLSFTVS